MRVCFRIDAGPTVGVGHAMRCSVLAKELVARGHQVDAILVPGLPQFVLDRYESAQIFVSEMAVDEVDADVERCDLIVVDGYRLGDFVDGLAAAGVDHMLIDDNAELPNSDAVLILNQNLHAPNVDYSSAVRARLLLGAPYTLIRDDIVDLVPGAPPPSPLSVLVAFGGSDPARLTVAVATAVTRAPGHLVKGLVVALSESHADYPALVQLCNRSNGRVRLAESTLTASLADVGLAIIGGGSTMWELAHLGIPAVAAVVADNQVEGAASAERCGFVVAIDQRADLRDPDAFAPLIESLAADLDRRITMSEAGIRTLDGCGQRRVADAVEMLVTT